MAGSTNSGATRAAAPTTGEDRGSRLFEPEESRSRAPSDGDRNPPTDPIPPPQRRGMYWLLANTVLTTVFCRFTVFGSVFLLFLDRLGLDKGRIGATLALLPLAGLTALFASPFVERIGYKRAYLLFFGIRKGVIALLLLTPWVVERWGPASAFHWVFGVVLAFALCRALGEIGAYALWQEAIPNEVRGRFNAALIGLSTVTGLATSVAAGLVVGRTGETARFLWLIGAGVIFGILSVACLAFVPGGAAPPADDRRPRHLSEMRAAIADPVYARFLRGYLPVSLAVALAAFTPLFLRERVGLSPGAVVWLEGAASLGSLASSMFWGRIADRRGSRPVLLRGLCLLALVPPLLILTPLAGAWKAVGAIAVMLLYGAGMSGWFIAQDRYFFVTAVPPEKKTAYIAVFYALTGLVAGLGSLSAGRILETFAGWGAAGSIPIVTPYTPLFTLIFLLTVAGLLLLRRVSEER